MPESGPKEGRACGGGRTPEPTPTAHGPTRWPTFPNETHTGTNRAKQVNRVNHLITVSLKPPNL